MRLLYVTSSFPFGPTEVFLEPELRELERRGHDVKIVPMFPRGRITHDDAKRFEASTLREPPISSRILLGGIAEGVSHPSAAFRCVIWCFAAVKPRLIAKNLSVLLKGLWLGRLARRWGADHIHAHWAATTASMALFAATVSEVSLSITAHRWDIRENNLLALKGQKAAFIRSISQEGKRNLVGSGVPETKVEVIHMGVEPHPIHDGREAGGVADRGDEELRIVVPANLVPVKGHVFLIEALARLMREGISVRADLVGNGPLAESLRSHIERLGLTANVVLPGVMNHVELLHGMAAGRWDVVVLPSILTEEGEQEGIPVALIEAMGMALPVIGTTTGGIPELITEGSGLLVPPADPDRLATALRRLASDPGLRMRLGATGRDRVAADFHVRGVVETLEERFLQAHRGTSVPAGTESVI